VKGDLWKSLGKVYIYPFNFGSEELWPVRLILFKLVDVPLIGQSSIVTLPKLKEDSACEDNAITEMSHETLSDKKIFKGI